MKRTMVVFGLLAFAGITGSGSLCRSGRGMPARWWIEFSMRPGCRRGSRARARHTLDYRQWHD